MGKRRVAIVGAGMTKFVRRALETPKELAYEASKMALDSCDLSLKDIDAVTIGTAPDAFDGVHMNGEFLKTTFLPVKGGMAHYQNPYFFCNGKLYQLVDNEDEEEWELHITDIE